MTALADAVLEVLLASPMPLTAKQISLNLHFEAAPGQLAGPLAKLHRERKVLEHRQWTTIQTRRREYPKMVRRWSAVEQRLLTHMEKHE